MKRLAIALLLTMLSGSVVLVGVQPAGATLPGSNGEIAYGTGSGARAISPDGSHDHALAGLTSGPSYALAFSPDGGSIFYTGAQGAIVSRDVAGGTPTVIVKQSDIPGGFAESLSMSPNGQSLVFCSQTHGYHLYKVHTDGSGLRVIPSTTGYCYADWGVGNRIVASKGIFPGEPRQIATMDPDGSHRTVIAQLPDAGQSWKTIFIIVPTWSPDGSSVAFVAQWAQVHSEIWSVRSDGTDLTNLTRTPRLSEAAPVYSPDGTQIVFAQVQPHDSADLRLMDADGTHRSRLTQTPDRLEYPLDWQPT